MKVLRPGGRRIIKLPAQGAPAKIEPAPATQSVPAKIEPALTVQPQTPDIKELKPTPDKLEKYRHCGLDPQSPE